MKKLDVGVFVCDSNESAEAMAILVEQSNLAVREDNSIRISTEELGIEGWAAVRRTVERLWKTFGKF